MPSATQQREDFHKNPYRPGILGRFLYEILIFFPEWMRALGSIFCNNLQNSFVLVCVLTWAVVIQ